MRNKRGSSMATSTIILLILGLIILVVLVIGFTRGWESFSTLFKTDNIDTIKTKCSADCLTNSEFGYCNSAKTVKDGENDPFEATCEELATNPSYARYGIESCPDLC
jgi:hypothetical protein